MRNTLKRVLARLRANSTGRIRKPTAARSGLQQPQRMVAVPVPARPRRQS